MGLFGKKNKHAAVAPVVPVAPVSMQAARPPFAASDFKIKLRMAKTRIEVQRTKRENSIVTNRRIAAEHLRNNKDELGRLFAEKTLRERTQTEAYDVVQTYVELMIETAPVLANGSHNFADLTADRKSTVASIVYAADRMAVQELTDAAAMLKSLFGENILGPIARGDEGAPYLETVNRLLAIKLDCTSPDPAVVREELINIANEYNVQWTAPPDTYSGAQPVYNPALNFMPNPLPTAPFAQYPGAGGAPPGYPGPPGGGYGGGGYGGGGGGFAAVNPAAIPGMGVPPTVIPGVPAMAPPPPPSMVPGGPLYPGTNPPSAPPSAPPSEPPSDSSYNYSDNQARFDALNRK